MLEDGWLTLDEVQMGQHSGLVFAIGEHVPPSALTEPQGAAVRIGVKKVHGKSAEQVSDESHLSSRAWKTADMGHELDVYLDLVPEEDVDERNASFASLTVYATRPIQTTER